jgi:PHP family Zn ribbon phosphoesterase
MPELKGKAGNTETTRPGYKNRNDQLVVRATGKSGTDFGQYIYVLRCLKCETEYGANGSDIFQRRCPKCQGGRPGLAY